MIVVELISIIHTTDRVLCIEHSDRPSKWFWKFCFEKPSILLFSAWQMRFCLLIRYLLIVLSLWLDAVVNCGRANKQEKKKKKKKKKKNLKADKRVKGESIRTMSRPSLCLVYRVKNRFLNCALLWFLAKCFHFALIIFSQLLLLCFSIHTHSLAASIMWYQNENKRSAIGFRVYSEVTDEASSFLWILALICPINQSII